MKKQARKPESMTVKARKRSNKQDEEKRRARRRAIVAYLVVDQKHDPSEVPDILRRSYGIDKGRSTVSRDMKWARAHGWIVTQLGKDCPREEHLEAVKQTAHFHGGLQEALRDRSGGTLKSIDVFWSGPTRIDADIDWDDRLSRFAARAAPTLLERLVRAQKIGVTFGASIGVTIEAVGSAARSQPIRCKDVMVVPTSGEPLGGAKPTFASTDLAERLSEILGGARVPSLRGIPPVIPEEFAGHSQTVVFDLIRCLRSYKQIFGDSDTGGLVGELDTLVTSAGGFGERYHAFQNEFVSIPGFTRERLAELALGDIGGVLIPKDGIFTKAQEKMFSAWRRLWTGIRIEQLRRISADAKNSDRPGVILVAIGANKAQIVQALTCRERVVNHLIIDESLAARLQELLNLPTVAAA